MRFVKLTDVKHGTTYVNLNSIVTLWWSTQDRNTTIRMNWDASGGILQVKETPEEILIKLPVIGG